MKNHGGTRCQLDLKAPLHGHSMKCLPPRYDDDDDDDNDNDNDDDNGEVDYRRR